MIKAAVKSLKKAQDPLILAFSVSFIAFTIGLLINALYIDVFEASKVALTFWALAGVLLGLQKMPAKISLRGKKIKSNSR